MSGFHALISASGTTPKMLVKETDARFIGYGAMLMESFVAIMALTAASVIDPGLYFGMNAPPAIVGATAGERRYETISSWEKLRHHAGRADPGRERRRREDAARPAPEALRNRSPGRHVAYPVQSRSGARR